MLASSPASILNHNRPVLGIPVDSISVDFALGSVRTLTPDRPQHEIRIQVEDPNIIYRVIEVSCALTALAERGPSTWHRPLNEGPIVGTGATTACATRAILAAIAVIALRRRCWIVAIP